MVGTAPAVDYVAAGAAIERVIAAVAVEHVGASAADDGLAALTAFNVLEVGDGFGVAREYEDLPNGQIDRHGVDKRNSAVINCINAIGAIVQIEIYEISVDNAIVTAPAVDNVSSPAGIDGIVAAEAEDGIGAAVAIENIVEGCACYGCKVDKGRSLSALRPGSR